MKYFLSNNLLRILLSLVFCVTLLCSCKKNNKESFYYSGNTKIELIIPGDTLGILLKDTVLNPQDTSLDYITKLKNFANITLAQQNFDSAGYLVDKGFVSDRIKLILSKQNSKNKAKLETEALSIKTQPNNNFIENTGYLARIKKTGKPIIITNELILQFKPGTSNTDINNVISDFRLEIKRKNPYEALQYTVATTANSPYDALKTSHKLKEKAAIEFAQPNFIYVKKPQGVLPNDPYYKNQWSFHNTDENATEDADADVDLAWDLTEGTGETVIGVIDVGFDVLQEDLKEKFAYNLLDIPWNGIDDDVNGYVDDTIGWNFSSGSNDLGGSPHGTAVTGIIGAKGNNNLGIIGACPQCKLLLVRTNHDLTNENDALSFYYALSRGAKIINCSWEYDGMTVPDNVQLAIKKAFDLGIVVIGSTTNSNEDYCGEIIDLASLDNVIGVSRSTNKDMNDLAGHGSCLDLLAPTANETPGRGDLNIYTTDVMGLPPYNSGTTDIFCDHSLPDANYTGCFRGTSASAALTSGVAGLILSAHPCLGPKTVQYLLQDCADKIENSVAKYDRANGKSITGTHGYGRLNAYEAVKIASPDIDKGGRNGVDVFVRDNELDWGNTEKPSTYLFEPIRDFIPCWESMDIKVDRLADIVEPPVLDNTFFENLRDENPEAGGNNKVYVRVRNRGFNTATSVMVNLYWVHAGAGLPLLPDDFWNQFPEPSAIPSEWKLVGSKPIFYLDYCGASVANTPDDKAQIVSFNLNPPPHDPSSRNHYCLMAIISSPNDPMPTEELKLNPNRLVMDYVTSHYNNVTHRNYNVEFEETVFNTEFYLYNPFPGPINTKLEISFKGQKVPVTISDSLLTSSVYLGKNEKRLIKCNIDPKGISSPTKIIIEQKVPLDSNGRFKTVGGISYLIMPSSKKDKK